MGEVFTYFASSCLPNCVVPCELFSENKDARICKLGIISSRMAVLPSKSVEGLLSNVLLKSRRAAKRPHGAAVRYCTKCTMKTADMAPPEKKNVNVSSRQFTVYNGILIIFSSRESWCSGDPRIFALRMHPKTPSSSLLAIKNNIIFLCQDHRS